MTDATQVCPYNHVGSKFFQQFPAQHLEICKCDCDWCARQFGDKVPGLCLGRGEDRGKDGIANMEVRRTPLAKRDHPGGTR